MMNSRRRAIVRRGVFLLLVMTAAPVAAQTRPAAYGTTTPTYYRVGSPEFTPYANTDNYFSGTYELWPWGPPGVSTGIFYATPHLPSGALLTYLELDYCDTNPSDQHILLSFMDCDPIRTSAVCGGAGTNNHNIVSVTQPVDAACATASLPLSNYTVDNATHMLVLQATFGAFDGTNRLRGVVIGYTLQVSPPPASPTFADVPATSPYFQFVEALAAAGITVGCGGGNFCPDGVVTRAQMALFLAKALGLNWSQ